jgi:hypothetical protein
MERSDMMERRQGNSSTMWRTRIVIGSLSVAHGIGGAIFEYGSGISELVQADIFGWMFAAALIAFGSLMVFAAAAEHQGFTQRWCREFSASLLGATWIAVFFNSIHGDVDTITILAPLFVASCFWAWWIEATIARRCAISKRTGARE